MEQLANNVNHYSLISDIYLEQQKQHQQSQLLQPISLANGSLLAPHQSYSEIEKSNRSMYEPFTNSLLDMLQTTSTSSPSVENNNESPNTFSIGLGAVGQQLYYSSLLQPAPPLSSSSSEKYSLFNAPGQPPPTVHQPQPPIPPQLLQFSDKKKLFVGNLPTNTTLAELVEMFKKYGQVNEQLSVVKDDNYAFIHFYNEADAERAYKALNDSFFKNRYIRVQYSVSKGHIKKSRTFDSLAPLASKQHLLSASANSPQSPLLSSINSSTVINSSSIASSMSSLLSASQSQHQINLLHLKPSSRNSVAFSLNRSQRAPYTSLYSFKTIVEDELDNNCSSTRNSLILASKSHLARPSFLSQSSSMASIFNKDKEIERASIGHSQLGRAITGRLRNYPTTYNIS
jgi:RNA recognition motif-containing protein